MTKYVIMSKGWKDIIEENKKHKVTFYANGDVVIDYFDDKGEIMRKLFIPAYAIEYILQIYKEEKGEKQNGSSKKL